MHLIKSNITCKNYFIDLFHQKIRIENIVNNSSRQINKLIKQDWVHIYWTKDEKKNIWQICLVYVNAGKANKSRRTSFLVRVTKVYEV